MSYSLRIALPGREACAHCGRGPDDERTVGRWDPTWNLGPMLRLAGLEFGTDSPLHGRPARDWATALRAALAAMDAAPDRFRALDPPNGWGSYDSLLPVLREMLAVCERYPDAVGST